MNPLSELTLNSRHAYGRLAVAGRVALRVFARVLSKAWGAGGDRDANYLFGEQLSKILHCTTV